MFITQVTIVTVLWRLQLIYHIGAIICYAGLYILYRAQFKQL